MTALTDGSLRIATFNIRYNNRADGDHSWARRRSAVRQCIEQLRCEVLGLQEVLAAQRRYLRSRLRAMQWYGVGRDDGRRRGEQSPVLVRRDAFEVTDWSTVWLSSTPEAAGSTGVDTTIPRIATIVRGRVASREIGVLNTHFDHRGTRAREQAAEQIARLVSGESRAWVVCGDFNVSLGDGAMQTLTGAGLRSVPADDAHGTFHAFAGSVDCQRIDHILVDDEWVIDEAYIDTSRPGGIIPSDHWPVLAALSLRG